MIIIGGPIYKREWILPHWFEAIEKQTWPTDQLGFVFETSRQDKGTRDMLFEWHSRHPEVSCFEVISSIPNVGHVDHGPSGQRRWSRQRYVTMALLRNAVLQKVRVHMPERFFSLDSDIILENPNTLAELYEFTRREEVDAVNPLLYMTPTGTRFPSVMSWVNSPGGFALRNKDYPLGTRFKTDVIMAAKMMTPNAYMNIDYGVHRQGEDLAWSAKAAELEMNLYCASDIYAAHIMSEPMLESYLANGDPRTNNFVIHSDNVLL